MLLVQLIFCWKFVVCFCVREKIATGKTARGKLTPENYPLGKSVHGKLPPTPLNDSFKLRNFFEN